MNISIGCDHAGFEYKEAIKNTLKESGYEVTDRGTFSAASVDYPDFAHEVARDVESHSVDYGILICGSGNGVCITANKHQGIRAALCWNNELGSLARQHNDANVLCLPARFIDLATATQITLTFLKTEFEGGRHENRVKKIPC